MILGIVAAGCSSSGSGSAADQAGAGRRVTDAGLSLAIPTGWHRVPLAGLPGADVPMELASFEPRGAVRTICDPHRIVRQIPTGGALVQILETSRAALDRERERLDEYPQLRKPFRLGSLQAQECGESYDPTPFRLGDRVFGLRIWTAPTGASAAVRQQIEQLMDRFGLGAATASAPAPHRLAVSSPR